MKKHLVLVPLLALLAGCATQPQVTVRRGKIIKLAEPAPTAAPATPATPKPAVAPAPAAPLAAKPAAPAPAPAPVAPPPAPAPASTPPPAPAPVVAAPPTPAPKPVPAPVAPAAVPAPTPESPLVANRNGAVVQVGWALPESDVAYKAIEIMRNDRSEAQGRTRVRAVRATVTKIEDTVPDAAANYWYWLKLTRADGQIRNIGPIAAPRG